MNATASVLRRGLGVALLSAAVVVLAAWAIHRATDGGDVLRRVAGRVDPLRVVAGLLVISTASVLAAARWRCLLPEPARRGNLWLLTGIQCVGVLVSYALPGPAGDLAIAWMAARRFGIGVADALVAAAACRVLGLGVAGVLAGLTGPWLDLGPLARQAMMAASVALLALGLAAGMAVAVPTPLRRRLAGRRDRLTRAADRLLEALEGAVARGWRPIGQAAAWTALGHTTSPTGLFLAAGGLGAPANWAGVVFTNNLATVGSAAFVFLPAGPLGWDVLYATVLAQVAGIGAGDAALLTALGRVQQSALVAVGALAVVWMAREVLPERVG